MYNFFLVFFFFIVFLWQIFTCLLAYILACLLVCLLSCLLAYINLRTYYLLTHSFTHLLSMKKVEKMLPKAQEIAMKLTDLLQKRFQIRVQYKDRSRRRKEELAENEKLSRLSGCFKCNSRQIRATLYQPNKWRKSVRTKMVSKLIENKTETFERSFGKVSKFRRMHKSVPHKSHCGYICH